MQHYRATKSMTHLTMFTPSFPIEEIHMNTELCHNSNGTYYITRKAKHILLLLITQKKKPR
uniref:Uncharacterized protein n=1 Tax=Rhizophora mucronata TaxID=61149 RepID=A0A2P2P0Z5_RHIMU